MDASVAAEIATALERLEEQPDLVDSWSDTLSDEAVLEILKAWNSGARAAGRYSPFKLANHESSLAGSHGLAQK
jgi:hypothetical protein